MGKRKGSGGAGDTAAAPSASQAHKVLLGAMLRNIRLRANLSQDTVAGAIGCAQSSIVRWESCATMDLTTLWAYIEACGESSLWVLRWWNARRYHFTASVAKEDLKDPAQLTRAASAYLTTRLSDLEQGDCVARGPVHVHAWKPRAAPGEAP